MGTARQLTIFLKDVEKPRLVIDFNDKAKEQDINNHFQSLLGTLCLLKMKACSLGVRHSDKPISNDLMFLAPLSQRLDHSTCQCLQKGTTHQVLTYGAREGEEAWHRLRLLIASPLVGPHFKDQLNKDTVSTALQTSLGHASPEVR